MGALDAFYSTWQSARDTFGQGTPQDGSRFDGSLQLTKFQESVGAAKPDYRWQGPASDAYAAKNRDHAAKFGVLAGCDQRLSAEVTNAANVVTAGRQNLDQLKSWVDTMARSVPEGGSAADRDSKLTAIANQGLSRLQNIIMGSHNDMSVIAGRMNGLTGEYQAAGGGKSPVDDKKLPEKPEISYATDPENDAAAHGDEEDLRKRAAEDVRKTLHDGDQKAAAQVDAVLGDIKPGDELTPEQDAYLSQMQSQQQHMSVDELKAAQEKLGDHKRVIGNSWQLMSNDDVGYGDRDSDGKQRTGSFEKLPESVQSALSNNNLIGIPGDVVERHKVEDIADIVRDGDAKFQDGTEIDRAMIRLSDRLMDESPANQETVRELFTSAGRDHQVVTDHLVGHQPYSDTLPPGMERSNDYDSDDFMMDIMTMGWADDGKDAASLFSWTNESAKGADQDIASAAAERYAQFIGSHKDELMDVPNMFGMTDTLGQVNPELVKGLAHGLVPYMADIASIEGGADDNFEPLETAASRPLAQGIFSVLDTQVDAYREFNVAANQLAVEKSYEWANEVKQNGEVYSHDNRMLAAATLKGLIDHGTAEGLTAIGKDEAELRDLKRSVYSEAVSKLSDYGGSYGKALGAVGSALEDSFFGDGNAVSGKLEPMSSVESARFAANALYAVGVHIPGADEYLVPNKDMFGNDVLDESGNPTRRFGTLEELREMKQYTTEDVYGGYLNEMLDRFVDNGSSSSSPADPFAQQYERVARG